MNNKQKKILIAFDGSELSLEAVKYVAGRALLEASGGITLKNIKDVAATGVDMISIGALTHSVRAVDLSLEISRL